MKLAKFNFKPRYLTFRLIAPNTRCTVRPRHEKYELNT